MIVKSAYAVIVDMTIIASKNRHAIVESAKFNSIGSLNIEPTVNKIIVTNETKDRVTKK